MRPTIMLLLISGVSALTHGKTIPYAREFRLLDQISAAVGDSQNEKTDAAIELLTKVALGRAGEFGRDAEDRLGVAAGALRQNEFKDASVRVYAFQKIGQIGLPEALEFLTHLKQDDIGPDSTQMIWPAAQVAHRNALLSRIVDPQMKVEFLEKILTEPRGGWGAVGHWAVEQLCNGGSLLSIGIVQKAIRSRSNGERGEAEIAFCEERMKVVSRNPDRVKAIGSILKAETSNDDRLTRWAMYQLASLRSQNADSELNRFAAEIGRLPAGSRRQGLSSLREEITGILAARTK